MTTNIFEAVAIVFGIHQNPYHFQLNRTISKLDQSEINYYPSLKKIGPIELILPE